MAIIKAHAFNDGNKRTALAVMELLLMANGIDISYDQIELADVVVKVAAGEMDEDELVRWLYHRSG